ncbi:uncharacterized protein LOC135396614 [Ornithodoros turicata]|uniref:uncharacterized protein LOC135396614 n=1 Tax=Ornithodoros turicata TaxID=34597 RepID=UPI0031392FAD
MCLAFLVLAFCTSLANLVVVDTAATATAHLRERNCTETAECQRVDKESSCIQDTCACSTGYHLITSTESWYCISMTFAPPVTTMQTPRGESFKTPPRYNIITVVIIIAVLVMALVFLISKRSLYFYFPCCMGPTTLQMLHDGSSGTGFPGAREDILDPPPSYAEAVLDVQRLPAYHQVSLAKAT